MLVKELIVQLQALNPEAIVTAQDCYLEVWGGAFEITGMEFDETEVILTNESTD